VKTYLNRKKRTCLSHKAIRAKIRSQSTRIFCCRFTGADAYNRGRGAAVPTSLVEVLWTARYDYQPHWRLAEHKHEYFQMIYFVSGSASVSLGKHDHLISPGSLLLVKPRCIHGLDPVSQVKTLDIKFQVKDRRLRKLLMEADNLLAESEPGIADLLERIRHEGERKRPFYRELCSAFLMELLLLYLRSGRIGAEMAANDPNDHALLSDWIVQQATKFIREHHAEDCSLREIAHVVGRSDRHVRQHFNDVLGVSPRRYLLQYRIRRAQQLIEFSSYAFKEIAEKVGFKTVHHFTRAFHDICGETPGAWRRKYQDGICKDVNIDPDFVNTNWTVRAESARRSQTLQ
jgi:AraC-like DNA-binding protein/mannose-6-phosphate isomerase-like protein (cupin superfamily)